MPTKPPTACRRPGCRGVVRAGVCSACGPIRERSNWDRYHEERNQASRHVRGYGIAWEKLRRLIFSEHPLCRQCAAGGRVVLATELDHIIPKSWGGTDDRDNLQPLCAECHDSKTRQEVRGRLKKAAVTTIVVAGPPGSGKSTYVAQHKKPGDLIWDADHIMAALSGLDMYDERRGVLLPFVMEARQAVLLRLARTSAAKRAWIITAEGNGKAVRQMANDLGATLVVLDVPASECIARIAADSRRSEDTITQWQAIVERWWDDWRATEG